MRSSSTKSVLTVLFVQLALIIGSAGFTASKAEAGALTTSESIVTYARNSLSVALGEDYQLKPGTIEIEDEAGLDVGNALRSIIGAEEKKYIVTFMALDRAGHIYRGRTKMIISAISELNEDRENDNNTTQRGTDQGTDRLIKIQLISYLQRSQPITAKQLYLVRLSK